MKNAKRERLEASGWKIGTAEEFLGLSREEAAELAGIGRAALYERIVLPRALVDRSVAALVARGELRVLPDGGIAINVC